MKVVWIYQNKGDDGFYTFFLHYVDANADSVLYAILFGMMPPPPNKMCYVPFYWFLNSSLISELHTKSLSIYEQYFMWILQVMIGAQKNKKIKTCPPTEYEVPQKCTRFISNTVFNSAGRSNFSLQMREIKNPWKKTHRYDN